MKMRKKIQRFKIGIYLPYLLMATYYFHPTASTSHISFEKTYGGVDDDLGWSVQQTQDGGYILTGYTNSFGEGLIDVYLIKTDSLGNVLWLRTYGGTGYELGRSVQETQDGGYIIAGYTTSFGSGLQVFLIKTNSLGDTLWTKTYGDFGTEIGWTIEETQDGGFIIAGSTDNYDAQKSDVYLIRTNSLGDTFWTKTYGDTGIDIGWSVQETSDGGFIIAGYSESFGAGLSDVYLIKTDSSGESLWTKTYGGIWYDYGYSVRETSDSGYVIAGKSISFSGGSYDDVYLIKTNSQGDTLWTKVYGGIYNDGGYSVQQTADEGYIITGYTAPYDNDTVDVYLIKTDSAGNTLWTRTFGGSSLDNGYSVQQTLDSGYIIVGFTKSYGAGGEDVFLIKTAEDGTVGVEEPDSGGFRFPISDLKLFQNQPNPFHSTTMIRFMLPASGYISLKIFDITGRLVEKLVDGSQESGVYRVEWEGKDQGSGVYFYRLTAGGFVATKKLILLR